MNPTNRVARGAGFVLLGGLGSLALAFPLFGALGYLAMAALALMGLAGAWRVSRDQSVRPNSRTIQS